MKLKRTPRNPAASSRRNSASATSVGNSAMARESRGRPATACLAESSCQRLGFIGPLQPHEPVADVDVTFGEFELDRGQGRGILLADEDLEGLGSRFAGNEQRFSARCRSVCIDPVDRAPS